MTKEETMGPKIITTGQREIAFSQIVKVIPTSGAFVVYLGGEFNPVFVTREAFKEAGIRVGC